MRLKSLTPKRVTNRQSIEDIIKDGFCPICREKLTESWNKAETHKYQFCNRNITHHRLLIDYMKDSD